MGVTVKLTTDDVVESFDQEVEAGAPEIHVVGWRDVADDVDELLVLLRLE